MSWKITSRKSVIILVGITLLLTALNSWLSMEFPADLGYVSESPLGIYRFRLVTYDIDDYGSRGSVRVRKEFGGLYEGILVALGKEFIYRTSRYEYRIERDAIGIGIFLFYLALLAVNLVLLVVSLILIPKHIKAMKWLSKNT